MSKSDWLVEWERMRGIWLIPCYFSDWDLIEFKMITFVCQCLQTTVWTLIKACIFFKHFISSLYFYCATHQDGISVVRRYWSSSNWLELTPRSSFYSLTPIQLLLTGFSLHASYSSQNFKKQTNKKWRKKCIYITFITVEPHICNIEEVNKNKRTLIMNGCWILRVIL